MKHLYAVALTLWMYCSAIFYPADQLSGPIRWVVEVNPLYLFIRVLRSAVMEAQPPSGGELLLMLFWGGGVYLVGRGIFRACREAVLRRL